MIDTIILASALCAIFICGFVAGLAARHHYHHGSVIERLARQHGRE